MHHFDRNKSASGAQLQEATEKLAEAIELLREARAQIDGSGLRVVDAIDEYLARVAPESETPTPESDYIPVAVRLGLVDPEPSEPVSEEELRKWEDLERRATIKDPKTIRLIADLRQAREEIASERRLKRQWQDAELKSRARIAEMEAQAQELQGAVANATGHPLSDVATLTRENEILHEERDRYGAELDAIMSMPDVGDRLGIGDGSVADAVTAIIGALVCATRERDAAEEGFRYEQQRADRAEADLRDEIDSWKHDSVASLRARIAELEKDINFQVSVRSAEHADRKREVATLTRERDNYRRRLVGWKEAAEKAESERDAETARADGFSRGVADLLKRVEKAEAERDRLRDALRQIRAEFGECAYCDDWRGRVYAIARAALGEK